MLNNLTMAGDVIAKELPDATVHPLFYVGVYSAISMVAALLGVAAEWILFTGGLRSGESHVFACMRLNLRHHFRHSAIQTPAPQLEQRHLPILRYYTNGQDSESVRKRL